MKTAIVYYSRHHGNTKKLLDAIQADDPSVTLIDVLEEPDADLSGFERIGLASGIYCNTFAKQILEFAQSRLPENREVFFLCTHGAPVGAFMKGIRAVTEKKGCKELGYYHCQGFDTFGPFRLAGGIAKGHPDQKEIDGAVRFYRGL